MFIKQSPPNFPFSISMLCLMKQASVFLMTKISYHKYMYLHRVYIMLTVMVIGATFKTSE